MSIAEIRAYIVKQDFKITDHAFEEMTADDLRLFAAVSKNYYSISA